MEKVKLYTTYNGKEVFKFNESFHAWDRKDIGIDKPFTVPISDIKKVRGKGRYYILNIDNIEWL